MNSQPLTFVICFLLAFSSGVFAQENQSSQEQPQTEGQQPAVEQRNQDNQKDKTPVWDRFFFGGGLGLQFGSSTYIDVSPLIGYKITPKLHAGIGLTYIYLDNKVQINQNIVRYSTSSYGGRLFGRYYFIENAFAHVEYEYLNLGEPYLVGNSSGSSEVIIERANVSSVFVGGGYAQPIGSNAAVILMILWNLNDQPYSPYENPLFRIGFAAGF